MLKINENEAKGRGLRIRLTKPQRAFAMSMEKYPAIVAGFGSGKTQALAARVIALALMNKGEWVGFYAPSYGLIDTVARPRVEEMLSEMGFKFVSNETKKTIRIRGYGNIIFRSLSDPKKIIGFETCHAVADEFDTMSKKDAEHAFRMIKARNRSKMTRTKEFPNRSGQINTIGVGTTPEGFKFVYEKWGKEPKKGYVLIRASTYSNEKNLAPGYIDDLREMYPPALFEAYINGEFVNLTSGSVYADFDRILNGTSEVIKAGEELHIGMDFNVGKMAAVVYVLRNGHPFALDEFSKGRDTPTLCASIRARYGNRHPILIYPDASGNSASSKGAALSDFKIIQQAGFRIKAPMKNPRVRDRIAAMNAQVLNSAGVRRFRINTDKCPEFTKTLEQQVYDEKTGEPDKKAELDHQGDAGTYPIHQIFPISSTAVGKMRIVGA